MSMVRSAFSLLGIAGAIALFIFYTQPAYDVAKAEQANIAEYNAALEKASELQRLKQSLLSRYNAIDTASITRLQKLLPDHVDNVRLILDLDRMAARRGLSIENVVIGNPTSAPERTVVGVIGANRSKYDSLTLKFSTSGTYTDFIGFMRDLEGDLRIVDVVSLSLARGVGSRAPFSQPGSPAEPIFRYDLSIRTYWLK
jgi:Tfp pilus assembly protein PilO